MRRRGMSDATMETTAAKVAQQALARQYGEGVLHGMQTTLTLLLGEPADGGVPYMGAPLPEDAIRWAEQALAKSRAVGADA